MSFLQLLGELKGFQHQGLMCAGCARGAGAGWWDGGLLPALCLQKAFGCFREQKGKENPCSYSPERKEERKVRSWEFAETLLRESFHSGVLSKISDFGIFKVNCIPANETMGRCWRLRLAWRGGARGAAQIVPAGWGRAPSTQQPGLPGLINVMERFNLCHEMTKRIFYEENWK